MAKENITPEERLLKIIENPQGEKSRILSPVKTARAGGGYLLERFKNFRFDKDIFKHLDFQLLAKQLKKVITEANAAQVNQPVVSLPDINIAQTVDLAKRRNMFSFLPPVSSSRVEAALDAAQIIGALKLVGIIWSDSPQAMIEDTKGQKTYLLGNGDLIGDIKVKKIFNDKVVLIKDDKEWELR
ncbi:MAG: hypothetical protein NTY47_02765 [Candidatus Omnitrophica bacterium]|nr:hypothetical protein [Candidatus Omnitrophota bacterium]